MINQFYQAAKPVIIEILWLSKDAIHMHVGFLAFVIAYFLFKKLRTSPKLLLFPFALSLVMEILDAFSDIDRLGHLLFPAYTHDLINTNLIPVLVFLVFCRKSSPAGQTP